MSEQPIFMLNVQDDSHCEGVLNGKSMWISANNLDVYVIRHDNAVEVQIHPRGNANGEPLDGCLVLCADVSLQKRGDEAQFEELIAEELAVTDAEDLPAGWFAEDEDAPELRDDETDDAARLDELFGGETPMYIDMDDYPVPGMDY